MINIVLAEDHEVVRAGFRKLLEEERDFHVVGETGDGLEVEALVARTAPDVLITDLMLPGLNGLEVIGRVKRSAPQVHVVVLSMHDDGAYRVEAARRGASGYVAKEAPPCELMAAVRAAVGGRVRIPVPAVAEASAGAGEVAMDEAPFDPLASLTDREREVFQLAAEGCTLKETGARLSISPRTVEVHRRRVMEKLGLKNLPELVRYAVHRGVILPAPGRS